MWEIKKHFREDEKVIFEGTPSWMGYITYFILFGLWFIPPIIGALKKLSTKYVITDRRVMGRYGIISEDFKSASFKHITSVRIKQGLIGKMFNFGNIVIDTAGSGAGLDFVWSYVNNPIDVKNQIEKFID